MSFLPLMPTRQVLLMFTRVEKPAALSMLKGFNHVAWGWLTTIDPPTVLIIEPALQGANIDFVYLEEVRDTLRDGHIEIFELEIEATTSQKLFREELQTCASVVQYLCGIDLDCVLVQTLYDRLTVEDAGYLEEHGIKKVTKWEVKPNKTVVSLVPKASVPE